MMKNFVLVSLLKGIKMNSKAPALQRGIDILKMVGKNKIANLNELENELNIPRASLNRFIDCLTENDFLSPAGDNRNLSIGNQLLHLVMSAYEQNPLVMTVLPTLKRLAQQWQATFVLYGYKEKFIIEWLAKQEPEGGIRTMAPGFRTQYLNMNAQGQLFLSYLSEDEVMEYINSGMVKKATEYSLTGIEELFTRCNHIRRRGYAVQIRENSPVMQQIAVPLNISGDNSTYALGCFLPFDFNKTEKLAEQMLLACSRLSGNE
jgi:DNA-binding IclR family transcriptional regulator